MLDSQVDIPINDIQAYCATQPIQELLLFGSVLRDDFSDTSDVDVLVKFLPQASITYFDLFDIQQALQAIIGRKVDLLTPAAISDYFRDDVMQQALSIYERHE